MNRLNFPPLRRLTLWLAAGLTIVGSALAAADRPNIVLFYIDDWAWNGSPIPMDDSLENSFMPILEMPHVEKLVRQGMKFTNAYGSPQCAPARACLQTGQSSPRNGYTLVLGKMKDDYYDTRPNFEKLPMVPNVSDQSIDVDAFTIPEALGPFNYASAHLGKWHLYSDPGAEGYVLHDGDTDNKPGSPADPAIYQTDPKLMFSLTEKAIGFIDEQAKQNKPFFCQISHYAMHEWRQCLPETREKYARHPLVQAYYQRTKTTADTVNPKRDPAVWLGMGEDLDGRIGAVLQKLDDLGIADNTYVIVVADNGYRHTALQLNPDLTQPLHGHKWWAWQGGVRVPMFVRGPGIEPGSTFEGNVTNYDFLPTFVEWAGGNPTDIPNIDGVSLAGFMSGDKPDDTFLNRNIYFHVPHYREEVPHSAVISGQTKVMHFYERPDIPMMFDLSKEPGEVTNIARQFPAIHAKLFAEMMGYFKEVGARLPKVNPDYDPEYYRTLKNYDENIMWGPFEGTRPLEADEI